MTGDFSLADLTSAKGWVDVRCDLRIWILVPAGFPPELGLDHDTWAPAVAKAWWQQSGLRYGQDMVAKLAFMLETLRQDGYADFPCHQIWAHYRDFTLPPLPLHIGIWKMTGARDQQLRALSGAAEPDAISPPAVTEFTTDALGDGLPHSAAHKVRQRRGMRHARLRLPLRGVRDRRPGHHRHTRSAAAAEGHPATSRISSAG